MMAAADLRIPTSGFPLPSDELYGPFSGSGKPDCRHLVRGVLSPACGVTFQEKSRPQKGACRGAKALLRSPLFLSNEWGEGHSYIGIRADEDRVGYISTKPSIKAVYPFKEDGIDYAGVLKILDESGIGLPPYLKWGRSHSGCFFCFFQAPVEWVRLLEHHPDQFKEAMAYEKFSLEAGKTFTWIQGVPLSKLLDKSEQDAIKKRHADRKARVQSRRGNKTLVETMGGLEAEVEDSRACLMCQL